MVAGEYEQGSDQDKQKSPVLRYGLGHHIRLRDAEHQLERRRRHQDESDRTHGQETCDDEDFADMSGDHRSVTAAPTSRVRPAAARRLSPWKHHSPKRASARRPPSRSLL